jgi:squalene-hopene/tetraprenyl-beta-curcumene cyclase
MTEDRNRTRTRSTRRPSFGLSGQIKLASDSKSLKSAIERAQTSLVNLQHPEGFWLGELETNSTLCSDYLAFMHWSEEIDPDLENKCVKHLLAKQLANGGWSIYQGGPARIDPSVKAYFALKLAGIKRDDPRMRQAADLIRNLGGIEKTRYYTRFYLALLGQIPSKDIPAIPVELVLAPHWFPINLYSVSAWTRTMLVPMSIVHNFEPTRKIPLESGISELFTTSNRKTASPRDEWFERCRMLLKWLQRYGILPSRQRALITAERWIVDRTGEACSGLGAIFPSMLQTLIALRCLGYDTQGPIYLKAQAAFRKLFLDDLNGFRIQPCLSPIWDTALSIISLTESGIESRDSRLHKAARWLAARRVNIKGDWAARIPHVEPPRVEF